jgi:hypothetical protein
MKIVLRFVCVLALMVAPAATFAQAQIIKAPQPILVTSCGQSTGPVMLKVILQKAALKYEIEPLATTVELKTKAPKTLIITMGASGKGMGAAGISIDDELKRISALIDEAKKMKIMIIGAHVEGMKRRAQGADAGDTTDEQSIDAVAPKCDLLIVLKEGNSDNRFSDIAKAKKIPMIEVEKLLELVAQMEKLFK